MDGAAEDVAVTTRGPGRARAAADAIVATAGLTEHVAFPLSAAQRILRAGEVPAAHAPEQCVLAGQRVSFGNVD